MRLGLLQIRRLAAEVARQEDPALEVLATTKTEGAADYTEVILAGRHSQPEPARIVISVRRESSEAEARDVLRTRLRDYLRDGE